MFTDRKINNGGTAAARLVPTPTPDNPKPMAITLLTVAGEHARIEGKFDITDSIQIECEVGGELNLDGKLVIGEKGIVNANVQTAKGGFFNGNITKMSETAAHKVVAIDEKRGPQPQFASRA